MLVEQIYAHYKNRGDAEGGFRKHLGASILGEPCERKNWFSFRWVKREDTSGKTYRLFEHGKLEEQRVIDNLSAIGLDVQAFDVATGKQFNFLAFGGHFGGSLDGKVTIDGETHVLEIKTHNEKSFRALAKHGVRESKPSHFAQMQIYLGFTGLPKALYVAVNKNTDELHIETVERELAVFSESWERAKRIIFSDYPPPRISEKPSYFQCRWCHFHGICHGDELPNVVSCRSCLHVTVREDGVWWCEKHGEALDYKKQLQACNDHLYNPNIVNIRQTGVKEGAVLYDDGLVNRPGGVWHSSTAPG